MKVFILWLIMVIIELGMFHLWWVKIYMCERKSNVTIRKLRKDSFAFFRYLCHQKNSDEAMEDKKRISAYFLMALILMVMIFGVVPYVFASAFARFGIILQIFFLLCFSGALYGVINDFPIARGFDEYIDFIKKYQKIRSGKGEKLYSKTDFADAAPDDRKSILDNKAVFAVVALVIIITASILVYYRVCNILHPQSTGISLSLNFNKIEIAALFVLVAVTLLVTIIDKLLNLGEEERENIKEFFRKKNGIIIDSNLSQWKDDIFQMCECLHIKSVHININNDAKDMAEATKQEDGVALIQISRYYFADMNQYFDAFMFKKVIMFIIGHELAHIYLDDRSKRRTAIIRIAIFVGYMFCLHETAMLLYVCNLNGTVFYLIWAFLAIYSLAFILSVIIDARYWGQIKELRADRVGMEVSGTSPDVFDAYASYCQHLNGGFSEKTNIIHFYYKQYIEVEEHPDLKRRSIELHRGKKWGIMEHIRYCWIIRWKSWIGRGWKL